MIAAFIYNKLLGFFLVCFLLFLWIAFFKRSVCSVELVYRPGFCSNDRRGILRACWRQDHKRVKRQTLFSWMRIPYRTPMGWRRRMAMPTQSMEARPFLELGAVPHVLRDSYEMGMLYITAIGSAAGVLALIVK